ncbi:hypothetical protein GCM10027612_72310 [Microbispora bryophytorum subsp. camponoti]
MKIAVIGGTGLIGSRVVEILNARGHEAVPHSTSTGVDLLSGRGLPEALAGADVVVNLTKPRTFDDASPAFFRKTMDNLLAGAEAAGVGHAVILSIVGAELVPGSIYYRAKVLQEDLLKAGPVPYSIVRSTQFFEFIGTVLSWTSDEHTVRLPATLMQPIAADEVARAVADVSGGARCAAPWTSPAPRSSRSTSWAGSPSLPGATTARSSPTTAPACTPPPRATPSSPRTAPSSPGPPIGSGSRADRTAPHPRPAPPTPNRHPFRAFLQPEARDPRAALSQIETLLCLRGGPYVAQRQEQDLAPSRHHDPDPGPDERPCHR